MTASGLEHVTFTTVPGSTGNCVVVSIVLVHSVFSPVHIGAVEDFNFFQRFSRLSDRNCHAMTVSMLVMFDK